MPGKRIQLDDGTWQAIALLASDRDVDFQTLATEAFRDLLRKHGRATDLKSALRQSVGGARNVHPFPGKSGPGRKAAGVSGRRGPGAYAPECSRQEGTIRQGVRWGWWSGWLTKTECQMIRTTIVTAGLALALVAGTAHSQQAGLVNVAVNDAQILNDLKLQAPVTVQVPVDVAANVCGIEANVITESIGKDANYSCEAKSNAQALSTYVAKQ